MLCQKMWEVPFGITAIVRPPGFSRGPPQPANDRANSGTKNLHHGGHGGHGGKTRYNKDLNRRETGLNLRVLSVLRGGEPGCGELRGEVLVRGASITIVLQAAPLPSDSRIAARCRQGSHPARRATAAT